MKHRPRKRFGQNFLTDQHVIQQIISSISPQAGQHIVEIGPGLGALTKYLLKKTQHLDVVEIDNDIVEHLKRFTQYPEQLHIHHCDVLKFDFASLQKKPLRIIGNLPYNISTPLCFHLLSYHNLINDMTFMLQKEVVERMTSVPSCKSYGRLSVMIQYYCSATQLFTVPPTAFEPQPKVDSAIIRLAPFQEKPFIARDELQFSAVVKQAFAHPRKTLRNNLKDLLNNTQILDIDLSLRPGVLSVEQYVKLANSLL